MKKFFAQAAELFHGIRMIPGAVASYKILSARVGDLESTVNKAEEQIDYWQRKFEDLECQVEYDIDEAKGEARNAREAVELIDLDEVRRGLEDAVSKMTEDFIEEGDLDSKLEDVLSEYVEQSDFEELESTVEELNTETIAGEVLENLDLESPIEDAINELDIDSKIENAVRETIDADEIEPAIARLDGRVAELETPFNDDVERWIEKSAVKDWMDAELEIVRKAVELNQADIAMMPADLEAIRKAIDIHQDAYSKVGDEVTKAVREHVRMTGMNHRLNAVEQFLDDEIDPWRAIIHKKVYSQSDIALAIKTAIEGSMDEDEPASCQSWDKHQFKSYVAKLMK
jgi:hypothetical protein